MARRPRHRPGGSGAAVCAGLRLRLGSDKRSAHLTPVTGSQALPESDRQPNSKGLGGWVPGDRRIALQAESLQPGPTKAEPGEAPLRFRATPLREAGETWDAEKERTRGSFLLGAEAGTAATSGTGPETVFRRAPRGSRLAPVRRTASGRCRPRSGRHSNRAGRRDAEASFRQEP